MNAIEVNNLTKIYRLYNSPKDRLREMISLSGRKFHHEFYALNDVSFTVNKGEAIGIIGQNGNGKSTLLKLICGVLQPSSGSIKVNGRISSLLELGAGFNPEFTGRENVYMNGALTGFSREAMEQRFSAIEEFADIGEFINQPVKKYSSGMLVRLAFSAAIHVEPEILIVDEALSVGDMYFKHRCIEKIKGFFDEGKTILLVTHDVSLVKAFCSRAILLVEGIIKADGEPEYVVEHYTMSIRRKQLEFCKDAVPFVKEEEHDLLLENRGGARGGGIDTVTILNKDLKETSILSCGEIMIISVTCRIEESIKKPSIAFQIRDRNGYVIYGTHTAMQGMEIKFPELSNQVTLFFSMIVELAAGSYSLTVALDEFISDTINIPLDKKVGVKVFQVVEGKQKFMGVVDLKAKASQSFI